MTGRKQGIIQRRMPPRIGAPRIFGALVYWEPCRNLEADFDLLTENRRMRIPRKWAHEAATRAGRPSRPVDYGENRRDGARRVMPQGTQTLRLS